MSEVQALVDGLAASLDRPVDVDDRQFRVVAYSSHVGEVDPVRRASLLEREAPRDVTAWLEALGIDNADGIVRVPANARFGMAARVCIPIRFDGTLLGYLWLIDEPRPLMDPELEEALRVAEALGIALFRAQRLEHEERERERELLMRLVDRRGSADPAAAAAELLRDGLLATAPAYAVVVLRAFHEEGSEAPDAVRVRLASAAERVRRGVAPRHLLVLVTGGQLVGVLACTDAGELERRGRALAAAAEHTLRDAPGWSALVAASEEHSAVRELPAAYDEAHRTLRIGSRVERVGPFVRWSQLGAYRTIAELLGDREPPTTLPTPIRRLLSCNGASTLVPTLECYLDLGGDARGAAAALHLHRSSLYGRLRRIEEVAGVDLRSGEDRLELHLGLRLWRLIGAPLRD